MLAAKQAEEIENQQKQITSMKPKAEYFDEVIDRNGLTNFRDIEQDDVYYKPLAEV